MSSSWILGEEAVNKICLLDKRWKKMFCEAYSLNSYTPFYQDSTLHKLAPDLANVKLFETSNKLKSISQYVQEGESFLGKVGVKENHFKIHTETQSKHVTSTLEKSLKLLFHKNSWLETLFNQLVYGIVPIQVVKGGDKAGFSSIDAKGLIFYYFNEHENTNKYELAIDIAHEIGHQSLFVYQAADNILQRDFDKYIYSSIKQSNRPAVLVMHAYVAIGFMSIVTNSFLDDFESEFLIKKYKELLNMFYETFTSLESSKIPLTLLGDKIFNEIYYKVSKLEAA